ncbi:MAG: hypothetical protein M1820_003315 [Bogoriella megaspora]|nr:MAG: hypothetical protein M1820_003315 [Bogoriella megaspora]
MALSTETSPGPTEDGNVNRRTSGRVSKLPQRFSGVAPNGSVKRKRSDEDDEGISMQDEDASDESEDQSEEEPDEEEIREQRRVARKSKTTRDKPAPKKARPNRNTMDLAIRTTGGAAKKSRKAASARAVSEEDLEGLYGQIIVQGKSAEDVVAEWTERFKNDEAGSVAELVNLALKAAGCNISVDVHDIRDPDNASGRLSSIQEEFQAQNLVDYPLIARGKSTATFKKRLVGFFRTLIQEFPVQDLLVNKVELIQNLQAWLPVMTSAATRPFRHTSTVICCAIISGLADVGRSLAENEAQVLRQTEAENKKARANKSRVTAHEKKMKEVQKQREALDELLRGWLDSTFIHRYRDVDPRIRTENVIALGDWIVVYPEYFFDGHHLRYLGWLLSDTSASIRSEVLRQLLRMYKDNDKLGGLKSFTERFRTRMVEMATSDAEATVRASAVELLSILREAGLLAPDDFDTVGKLIFDSEPRVRKSVIGFFTESINDVYESKLEDLNERESLEALTTDTDEYESPRLDWLRLKCLVETLQSYDDEGTEGKEYDTGVKYQNMSQSLGAAQAETRFTLAAQALCEAVPEVKNWRAVAGYLLFDHSQRTPNGVNDDPEAFLKQECRLTEAEEIILLEILGASVKLSLAEVAEELADKNKKSKARKAELLELQEDTARHLALLIPRLLQKFGAVPDSASAVLRLGHVLNLDIFQQMRQDSTTFASLLDDINKQFLTHGNHDVLGEATTALMHAKKFDELEEVTDAKLQALWEPTINALCVLGRDKDLATRGNLDPSHLTSLSNTVLRIAHLVQIADCTEILETAPGTPAPKSKSRKEKHPASKSADPVTILTSLIHRAAPSPDSSKSNFDLESSNVEDGIAGNAATALMFYFLWKLAALKKAIESGPANSMLLRRPPLEDIAARRDALIAAIGIVFEKRVRTIPTSKRKPKAADGSEDVMLGLTNVLLDVATAFTSTLRTAKPDRVASQGTGGTEYLSLVREIPGPIQQNILKLLESAEKDYAGKLGRTIELGETENERDADADINEDPESDDDDETDEGETNGANAEGKGNSAAAKKQHDLLESERRLCDVGSRLVLAILCGAVDAPKARACLERNKTKLGPNWKEVVLFLEKSTAAKPKHSRAKSKPAAKDTRETPGNKGTPSTNGVIEVEDDGEEEDMDVEEEEEAHDDREATDEHVDNHEQANGVAAQTDQDEMESVVGD